MKQPRVSRWFYAEATIVVLLSVVAAAVAIGSIAGLLGRLIS